MSKLKNVSHQSYNIVDSVDVDITKVFDNIFSDVDKIRASGEKVLAHCKLGMSRSATVVIGYLMHAGIVTSLRAAYEMVVTARPIVMPNEGFRRQLCKYEAKLFNGQQSFSCDKEDVEFIRYTSEWWKKDRKPMATTWNEQPRKRKWEVDDFGSSKKK